jgi:very-short-patch-repair endonuclease
MARTKKLIVDDLWNSHKESLINEFIEDIEIKFLKASTDCESPIEKIMYMALQDLEIHFGSLNISITPQAQIDEYRVDFLVVFQPKFQKDRCNKCLSIVIECDGHDWHEKTKEQAARDKKRDRELLKKNYLVIRFTGSEIVNDSNNAMLDIAKVIIKWFKP